MKRDTDGGRLGNIYPGEKAPGQGNKWSKLKVCPKCKGRYYMRCQRCRKKVTK